MPRPHEPVPFDSGDEPARLRRALTTPLLTLYGLGVTVGAGIYVLIGSTAAEAGHYAPLSFVVAALVVAFTAFSYAELSTRYPVSAGEAAYVEAGFNRGWLASIVGLAVALSGMVSSAAIAMGAASYLQVSTGVPPDILTIGVVLVMGGIALLGIAQSVSVAAIITVLEISGLLFVIVWGLGVADPMGAQISDMVPPAELGSWTGIFAASLLAFFAFVGFEDMANVAEEVKDPVRSMPTAIFWTLIVATLLYIGTATAVLVAVPIETLAKSEAPLALVFANAPEAVRQGFALIAVVATVNGVLIQMIMASRVLYGLADKGHLPSVLKRVSPRTRTPSIATFVVIGTIILLTQAFPISALAEHTSQIVLFVFVLVNIALIRLKTGGRSDRRHFRVPMVVPVLGVLSSLLLFGASFL